MFRERSAFKLLQFEYLGFAAFYVWHLVINQSSDQAFAMTALLGGGQAVFFAGALAISLLFIYWSPKDKEKRSLAYARLTHITYLLGVLGAIVTLIVLIPNLPGPMVFITTLITGITCGAFEITWFVKIAMLPPLSMQANIFAMTALGTLVAFLLGFIPIPQVRAIIIAALLLVSIVFLRLISHEQTETQGDLIVKQSTDDQLKLGRQALIRMLLAGLVFSFVFYLTKPLVTSGLLTETSSTWRLWSKLLVAAVLFAFMLFNHPLQTSSLFRIAMPVSVIGFGLALIDSQSFAGLSYFVISAGNKLFDLLITVFILRAIYQLGLEPYKYAAIWAGIRFFAGFAGLLGSELILDALDAGLIQITVLIPAVICLLVVFFAWLMPESLIERIFEPFAPESKPAEEQINVSTQESDDQRVTLNLQRIAEEKHLTPRETEVLALLAQGRSLAVIMERLSISQGTAQSHKTNIYRKLDVHSQQELIGLIRDNDNL
ncbi:MAG: hypothetical protein IKE43_10460 [Coriobacteriales bacterium]|nr:hypothetical protein [Coriobacteriales bacterium]